MFKKSSGTTSRGRFAFHNNLEKIRAELAFFSLEKMLALNLTSFLFSALFSYEPITRENFHI